MNFIYQDAAGEEKGPVNEEVLLKWAESGEIAPNTMVRNAMLKEWKQAKDLNFLKGKFPEVVKSEEKAEQAASYPAWYDKYGFIVKPKAKLKKSSSFKNEMLVFPASPFLRIMSATFDFIVMLMVAVFLFHCFSNDMLQYDQDTPLISSEELSQKSLKPEETKSATDVFIKKKEKSPVQKLMGVDYISPKVLLGENSSAYEDRQQYAQSQFNWYLGCYFVIFIAYIGFSVGLTAQTLGMWFWGLFVCRTDQSESFFFRSFAFAIGAVFLGWLSPVLTVIMKRSLHERWTGTQLIRISSKPK